jgi:hypothetical protein
VYWVNIFFCIRRKILEKILKEIVEIDKQYFAFIIKYINLYCVRKQTINKFHFVMLVAKLQFTSECQERTDHSGNAILGAGAFIISHTKYLKRGLLKVFWGPFRYFC